MQWQERLYTNLLATVHLVDSGLIDDWLRGRPLTTTDSLLAVKVVSMSKWCMRSQPTTLVTIAFLHAIVTGLAPCNSMQQQTRSIIKLGELKVQKSSKLVNEEWCTFRISMC